MLKISKKQVFDALHNQTVYSVAHNMPVVEDWDKFVEETRKLVESQGNVLTVHKDHCIVTATGQLWQKPKMNRKRVGMLQFRSTDCKYLYKDSEGVSCESYLPRKSMISVVDECTIRIETINDGYITYSLREES